MKKKVFLRGPLLSCSGYGVHARFVLKALRAYEDFFDIYADTIRWGQTSWLWQDDEERRYIDSILQKTLQYRQKGGKFDISLQVTIPNEFENYAPINIGITAGIETDKIDPSWVPKCNAMNKIITISEFSKNGILGPKYDFNISETGEQVRQWGVEVPVSVVHYPVELRELKELPKIKFETDFNFLVVNQWSFRKNIENTIAGFISEFKDNENVGLVLKISIKCNSLIDRTYTEKRIKSLVDSVKRDKDIKCKIYLLHGFMTEDEIYSLYNHPQIKCLVNIAHGECFGLPMFEAAYSGLPVVTTNFGGQVDFLKNNEGEILASLVDGEIKKIQPQAIWKDVIFHDSQWVYPEEKSFKNAISGMVSDYPIHKQKAEELKKIVLEKFEKQKQLKIMAEEILGEPIIQISNDELPKISIITSVFDAEEYMDDFCKDVVRQTIFNDKCEWVIVHPKTSPGFLKEQEVIKKYVDKHLNIKYIEMEEDKGLYWAWNIAIDNSSGEFITNWNCDDRRSENALERQAKELFVDKEVGAIYMDSFITNTPNEIFEKNTCEGRKYSFPEFDFSTLKMMNLLHANPIIRKELFDKYGKFDEQYKSAADWEFFLRCASKGIKYKKMSECLGLYYFSPKGISTNKENFKWKREEEKKVYNQYKDLEVKTDTE